MLAIVKFLPIFYIFILFIGCGDHRTNDYTYQAPTEKILEPLKSKEGECVPHLLEEDDGSNDNSNDNGDDDNSNDNSSTDSSKAAMPDNGRNNDDDEPEDDTAVNQAPLAYRILGRINVTVDCIIYPLITADSAERSIQIVPPTSTLMRMVSPTQPSPYMGLYKIEMGAYAIREERLYLDEGYLVFSFVMPDDEVNGYYKLISPPNKSGTIHVTYVEDQNAGFKMEGEMIDAEIYTNEDKNETYKLSLNFSTTILQRF